MTHADFVIGQTFYTADSLMRWLCTDIGTRTIAAIRIDKADPATLAGPPYSDYTEIVFDEYDFGGCTR